MDGILLHDTYKEFYTNEGNKWQTIGKTLVPMCFKYIHIRWCDLKKITGKCAYQ